MDEFVQDVLTKAENGEFPYQNIDESLRNKAAEILDEYYNNPYNVSGNVIGVDLQQGEVYISRWER